jgi:protein O-GlcNAc transferase
LIIHGVAFSIKKERRRPFPVRRYPNDPAVHTSLCCMLQDQGDATGALAVFREVIRLRPGYADAHLHMGLLFSAMGEMEQAIACYRQALLHDPNHPEALGALGMALRDRLTAEEIAACERLLAWNRLPE